MTFISNFFSYVCETVNQILDKAEKQIKAQKEEICVIYYIILPRLSHSDWLMKMFIADKSVKILVTSSENMVIPFTSSDVTEKKN